MAFSQLNHDSSFLALLTTHSNYGRSRLENACTHGSSPLLSSVYRSARTTINSFALPNNVWVTRVPSECSLLTGKAMERTVRLSISLHLGVAQSRFLTLHDFWHLIESREPVSMFHPIGSKPTVCTFAHTPNLILTGHESGKVALFDAETGEEVLNNERAHMDVVTDLQIAPDRSYFITSSKDKTARVSQKSCFLLLSENNVSLLESVTRDKDITSAEDILHRNSIEQCCNCAPPTIRVFLPQTDMPYYPHLPFIGSSWWWSRSHECHDHFLTAR